ncbi:MAG: carboxymuconolactone decarboxylase family protein [Acidimicrobiales bacterium]|nr:MAG: carboxymuconolactone decarboxylase family protein [Acidimicrobiales bacterium]
MARLNPPSAKQLKPFSASLKMVEEQMGFAPNSMPLMAHRPAMLGSSMLFMNSILGHKGKKVSLVKGLAQFLRTLKWTVEARKAKEREIDPGLKQMIAFVTSNASGCRYCQAHTAHQAHRAGVAIEKIEALWNFTESNLFTSAEKSALALAFAAGQTPNAASDSHFDDLRRYFTEEQIVEIVGIIAMFGFLNRWNDTLQTPLESGPMEFSSRLSG